MRKGVITQWDDIMGTIETPDGKQFFLHKDFLVEGTPHRGASVRFFVGKHRKGKNPPALQAVVVED